jgi:hypothetical protein
MANKYTNIKKWSITSRFKKRKTTTYDVVNRDSVLGQVQKCRIKPVDGIPTQPFW